MGDPSFPPAYPPERSSDPPKHVRHRRRFPLSASQLPRPFSATSAGRRPLAVGTPAPAPCTSRWLESICSTRVEPDRGMPMMKTESWDAFPSRGARANSSFAYVERVRARLPRSTEHDHSGSESRQGTAPFRRTGLGRNHELQLDSPAPAAPIRWEAAALACDERDALSSARRREPFVRFYCGAAEPGIAA